jgi:hypothetical protein
MKTIDNLANISCKISVSVSLLVFLYSSGWALWLILVCIGCIPYMWLYWGKTEHWELVHIHTSQVFRTVYGYIYYDKHRDRYKVKVIGMSNYYCTKCRVECDQWILDQKAVAQHKK